MKKNIFNFNIKFFYVFIFIMGFAALFIRLKFFSLNVNWVDYIFFFSMLFFFLSYLSLRIIKDIKKYKSLKKFIIILNKYPIITTRNNLNDLNEIINKEFSKDNSVKKLWKNFYNSFIETKNEIDDEMKVFQTIDAEYYFNNNTLFYENFNHKLFKYIPQGFVGLGLLGTFLGLSIGLDSLNLEPEALNNSIKSLLGGVKTSFYSSLYGMYFSIVFSIYSNIYLGEFEKTIILIKDKLNTMFNKNNELRTFDDIKNKIDSLKISTEDMAENIANELQVGLGDIKNSNEETLGSIKSSLSTFSENINDTFDSSLGNNLNRIFNKEFIQNFETIKDQLLEASTQNNQLIKSFKDEIKEISLEIKNTNDYYKESHESIIENLVNFDEKFRDSFNHFEEVSNKSIIQFKQINELFENNNSQISRIENFLNKSETMTDSLEKFIESEKSIIILWENYKESFNNLNKTINSSMVNYEENLRITSEKYESILKENFGEYKEIIDQISNEYTKKFREGLNQLFNDYDSNLSNVVDKFTGVINLMNENLDASNKMIKDNLEMIKENEN